MPTDSERPDLRSAHVIVVANEKGGTGKSTVSIHTVTGLLKVRPQCRVDRSRHATENPHPLFRKPPVLGQPSRHAARNAVSTTLSIEVTQRASQTTRRRSFPLLPRPSKRSNTTTNSWSSIPRRATVISCASPIRWPTRWSRRSTTASSTSTCSHACITIVPRADPSRTMPTS